MKPLYGLLLATVLAAGCKTSLPGWMPGSVVSNVVSKVQPAEEPQATNDLDGVVCLDRDVRQWPVTATLVASVSSAHDVTLSYDKARVWPSVDGMNANPWVLVKWTDGKTYAATWEWLRGGQTVKDMTGKSWAEHINHGPLNRWEPKSGETYGFMVSGIARQPKKPNVEERSNVSYLVWP